MRITIELSEGTKPADLTTVARHLFEPSVHDDQRGAVGVPAVVLPRIDDQISSAPPAQCEVCCFRPSEVDVNGWLLCRTCSQDLADG